MGTSGLGAIIRERKENAIQTQIRNSDIQGLKEVREYLQAYPEQLETTSFRSGQAVSKLTDESKELLNTWKNDGVGATQMVQNIDERINSLSNTSTKASKRMAQLGDTIVNGLVSLGASLVISLAIEGIQKLIHSYEDLAKAAQEYASKYTDNKSTIEGYSSEIRELRDVLADQNSSTEEVTNATSRLYEIQNELVGTYGSYANGIDLVNGKLNQQLEILDNINKQNAQEALNNINNERSAASGGLNLLLRAGFMASPMTNILNEISDLQKVSKGIKNEQKPGEVLKEMFFGDMFDFDLGETLLGSSVEQITDKFENFNATIKDIDDARIRQLAEGLDSISFDGDDLKIDGSVESVTEDITILQARLNELNTNGQFDGIVKKLQSINKDATETLTSSKEAYDTIIMSDIYNNAQLFDYYRQVQQAYEDIKKAESSGTFEEVQQAKNVYKELVDGIEQSGIDQKYIEYFERMYPELQSLVDEWKLEVEIIPKLDDNSKNLLKTTSTDELVAEYNKYFAEDRTVTKEIEDAVRANLSKGDAQALDYFKEYLSPKEYEEVIWKYVDELDLVSNDLQSLVEAYANSGMVDFESFVNATRGTKEYSEGMVHARELLGDNWRDEFEDEFTDEELEIAATIEPRYTKESQEKYNELVEKLPENFPGDLLDLSKQVLKIDPYKIDELKKLIEERLNPLELDIEPKVNSADAVEKLDKMESSFGGLTDIYNTTVTNKDIASANDIQSVNSGFGGVTFNEEDIGNVNALSNALEAYDDALVESKGDAEAAQQAVNKLVTAYIDQSGILDDLTEENKDYYIERLKANGVTNAAEVVESRLSEEVKRTSDNLKNLSKVVAQNRENLDKGVDAGADYTAAIEAISDSVKALLFTDADGKELIPNVNPEFITKNLDDIYKAVEGDIDALNRLRVEAAKEIAAHIDITSDNPQEVLDEVNALINAYPIDDIKVGTYLNDTPLIQGLNNLVKAGKITQESMNSILSSIGVTPEISYEKAKVTGSMINDVVQRMSQAHGGKAHAQLAEMRNQLMGQYKMEMQVPVIKYKATGGAGAKYSAPSAPKSSGGGGGGGGNGGGGGGSSSASEPNKPQEEAEDSFDWIEVAIQRIEEEIERLDKVVNNSYTTWTKRNSALAKELQKTKDEIKAQAIAQQEYTHYLGTIKVNNGKGLNADDYGENDQLVKQQDQRLLDEARRLWATGQYQRKIQNGQMTGNDIEKIQNHFLVDTINEYKEFYQKSVEARDAVEDLKIKLGELARVNFDNLQSEFEEAQAYFEATADLIDERINRTEQKGYFVSTNYYNELAANEKKNLASLQNEYNKLIAKRNEAISNAYIEKGSSEWNQMNQEILDVAKSIESATTNLVDFQNQIRQIKWDVFDYTRERIEKVNDEFEFLIDLLDNQKLYDDYGAFNDRGWADAALHAQKYNVYMQQSLDYAKERTQVEKELAKDKANKTLIERREELIKLQQESIQNSYAEKEAIRDLVEEGKYFALFKFI